MFHKTKPDFFVIPVFFFFIFIYLMFGGKQKFKNKFGSTVPQTKVLYIV